MPECRSCIRLWIQDDHCIALVDSRSQPHIRNIFDESEISHAVSYSAREDSRDKDSDIYAEGVKENTQNLLASEETDRQSEERKQEGVE